MFSEKGQAESQEQVCTILQIDKPVFDAKYLGLLTPLGRVKGTRFQHSMSVFKLPLGLCDDLTSIIRDFWWGTENGKRKTAWIAWEELLLKKCWGEWDLRIYVCLIKPCWLGRLGA